MPNDFTQYVDNNYVLATNNSNTMPRWRYVEENGQIHLRQEVDHHPLPTPPQGYFWEAFWEEAPEGTNDWRTQQLGISTRTIDQYSPTQEWMDNYVGIAMDEWSFRNIRFQMLSPLTVDENGEPMPRLNAATTFTWTHGQRAIGANGQIFIYDQDTLSWVPQAQPDFITETRTRVVRRKKPSLIPEKHGFKQFASKT